jgi:alkylated DNA repair dioxygenase AlkB
VFDVVYHAAVMAAVQGSLLDLVDPVGPRPLVPVLQRIVLSDDAWVDIGGGWIAGADVLFDRLLELVSWKAERRPMYDRIVDVPRLVSFYGEGERLGVAELEEARQLLTEQYRAEPGGPFTTAGLCLYRDGRDSVAWHGDTIGRGAIHDTTVAIVSLGDRRRLLLRPRGGGTALRFELGCGDLLVMGGSCQRTFEHAVPKTTRAVGPRISIQFRQRGVR